MVPLEAKNVRYIKLGEGGSWEKECRAKNIVRFGFDSARGERYAMARAGQWKDLTDSFLKQGKSKGTATRFTNETRLFFEDPGNTLWITFMGGDLYWGFLTSDKPERHEDGDGAFRHVKSGWRNTDLKGVRLSTDKLSGALTKLAAYRGTSCAVDVSEYAKRRISGQKTPRIEEAIAAQEALKTSLVPLMRSLGWRDFETLVDLVFTSSGWRRLGSVGKTQKTLDLDIWLPSTDERAFVQVKSETNTAELESYISKLDEGGPHQKMFFVHHTGEPNVKGDDRVVIIGPDKLAEMVLDAGLANWLIRKAH